MHLGDIGSTDDEPAVTNTRAHDFVEKASMDELTGTSLGGQHGDDDEVAAADTWSVGCLAAGGALDARAEVGRPRRLWTACSRTEWLGK